MGFEISNDKAYCYRCGRGFGRKRGYFHTSYGSLYKGSGYLPYCKKCIEEMYDSYYAKCGVVKHAVRQMCRVMNLYWNERVFNSAMKKATNFTIMSKYLVAINIANYAGRSYDDTLNEEGSLWDFIVADNTEDANADNSDKQSEEPSAEDKPVKDAPKINVTKKMVKFWGSVYPPEMIAQLEERYQYWYSRLPDDMELDIGTELLLKQISALDIDINNARAGDGKNLDRLISTQSNLLRDLNLKPVQRKNETNSLGDVPFGVGISWCEKQRPITEPTEEFRDVDGIRKQVNVWFYGHLAKMMGKKNLYSRLYEEEIAKLRVERPEFADENDDEFLANILSSESDEDGGDDFDNSGDN